LSYPLALTYGRYYAQLGTLSPLILAFFPLLWAMPRPVLWRDSRLSALTVGIVAGLLCWLVLMPSIFMPRYMLASLLLLGVPAAAAAVWAGERSRLVSASVIAATCATMLLIPVHIDGRFPNTFGGRLGVFEYLAYLNEKNLFAQDRNFHAHSAVNEEARTGDKVLLMSYHRYWLRTDLLTKVNTQAETLSWSAMTSNPDAFWKYVQNGKYQFVLFDPFDFPEMEPAVKARPKEIAACELPSGSSIVVLKLVSDCKPQ
jgi:hypothetical protein